MSTLVSKPHAWIGLALLVIALGSIAWPARAEDIKGWVLDFNRVRETVVLNDYKTYQIATVLIPADLKIGSTVNLTFQRSGVKMDEQTVTKIEILCDSFGASCTPPADRRP